MPEMSVYDHVTSPEAICALVQALVHYGNSNNTSTDVTEVADEFEKYVINGFAQEATT